MSTSIHQKISQKAFKMKIILELLSLEPAERSTKINEIAQTEFEIPFSTKKYLSRSTIYGWIKEYESTQDRENVLIRKERNDKGEWRKLSLAQQKALIRWRYENAYRTCEELREELIANELGTDEDIPSVSVIRRFLRKISMDRKTLTRTEPRKTKVRMSFEADYPNQLWMIDTKGPNIKIPSPQDPSKLVDAMPIVAIDDFSRYIVGVRYICKGQENEEAVMELLMEAFDKFGIPDSLYTDRGSPYMGKALEKALIVLGCRILHAKPRDCSAKGKVEKVMQLYYGKMDTELNAKQLSEKLTLAEVNEYAAAITHSYHLTVHRETDAQPYERYLNYSGKFRHYTSKQILSLLFLPTTSSKVTKDNLIILNKRRYLIPVIGYDGKFVEIRYKTSQPEIVYVWYENKFLGIGEEYVPQNDYLERQKYIQQDTLQKNIAIPEKSEVPEYKRLERKLQEYRNAMENRENINSELKKLKEQRAQAISVLTHPVKEYNKDALNDGDLPEKPNNISSNDLPEISRIHVEWTSDQCIHLLSSLFRRVLSSQERFAIHRVFTQYGPLKEKMVRQVVGKLLGESCPTNDLNTYLDAIRIEATINREGLEL